MSRSQEGRDEEIVDPDLPIVDAHHHLFIRPAMRYMPEEYLADAQPGHKIIASVYVEGGAFFRPEGPEAVRPIGEIEFANGIGAMGEGGAFDGIRLCAGIVGFADFRLGSAVGELFDHAMAAAPRRFRGVRQITMDHASEAPWRFFMSGRPPSGVLEHPRFREGFAELARRNLVFDAAIFHSQWAELAALADAFPSTTIVLNNLGTAMALDMDEQGRRDTYREWQGAIAELAKRPNVVCKVSGLGMPFWGFGLQDRAGPVSSQDLIPLWRPYVETALEHFGADRCMAASNYPPDSRSCGFVPLFNALKTIAGSASDAEKTALFSGTATRIYDLQLG